jgi:hypothetical protein
MAAPTFMSFMRYVFAFGMVLFLLLLYVVILKELQALCRKVRGFAIFQRERWSLMSVTGIQAGGQGTFAEVPLPIGDLLPPGVVPKWSTPDTKVTLTPSSDGSSCVAAVDISDTNTSFDLSVTATLPDGTTPTGKVTVPILPSEVDAFQINQTA